MHTSLREGLDGIDNVDPVVRNFSFRPSVDLIQEFKVQAIAKAERETSEREEKTRELAAADQFTREVDAAAVVVNASTRFVDGEEFGFGAEIGISTQKLHARGPMGLPELTTYKYVVRGDGQVRT